MNWWAKSLRRIGLFGTVALSVSHVTASSAQELKLGPALTAELNLVLKASDGLHKNLLTQDEEQIELGLRDLSLQLARARGASNLAKPHDRRHLVKIIEAAQEQFDLMRSSFGEDRQIYLQEGFNQIANLVRIYRLDSSYGIFFCPRDRTTWIQRGVKAQNPFRNEARREPCGIRVRK